MQLPELQPNRCQKSRVVGTCTDLPEWHKNILANVDIVLLGGFREIHLQITIMHRRLDCRPLNSDNIFFQKLTWHCQPALRQYANSNVNEVKSFVSTLMQTRQILLIPRL